MIAGEVIERAIATIAPVDEGARAAARTRQSQLTKPLGSLGRLEELHTWAAGVMRAPVPVIARRTIVVAAADHGVTAEGVSAYPADVTWQMVANLLAGGAAVNVLAAQAGAEVRVVDAGVAYDTAHPFLHVAKVRRGTANMARGPAMSRGEAETLVARGIEFAHETGAGPTSIVALGDMGIGNTTAAAAITSVMTGAPPRATAGRGTGIDDAVFATKVDAIERALALNAPDPADAIGTLAAVGGCEIAFLAGVALGAAAASCPVVVDGYPTTAAAMIAGTLAPRSVEYMLASHASAEPGHRIALSHLGLSPLLDLGMRLGEGTGAALALGLLDAALRLPREMATFESAGVSRAEHETQPEA